MMNILIAVSFDIYLSAECSGYFLDLLGKFLKANICTGLLRVSLDCVPLFFHD